MGFVLFHYTLFVLLGSIMASAACLSAYLVSRKRAMRYAFAGFLFYFFDVAWVFQDDFFTGADAGLGAAYAVVMSLVLVVTGGGFLTSFWLLVCDYLGEERRVFKVARPCCSWRRAWPCWRCCPRAICAASCSTSRASCTCSGCCCSPGSASS
ncbi:hypothetical protein [Gordonibacter urolithinfaciens]|uniref:hypothetical protein n=1 Tax=Gordonibacter urolithinfaciens TaxID=1335613 RepID=UPI0030C892F7